MNFSYFSRVPINHLVEEGQAMPVKKMAGMKIFWIFIVMMVCAGAAEQAMSQWASAFAELGLGVNKTVGDLLGPCMFAALMGCSRVFYGKFSGRINLSDLFPAVPCSAYAVICWQYLPLFLCCPWPAAR